MDFRHRFLLLIFLAFFFFTHEVSLIRAENHRPKNVHVALRAKWPGTSILLEAGELLSNERGNLIWNYIDLWLSDKEEDIYFHTAKGCLKKILKHGSSLLGEPLSSVFELSLLLRSASPRLVVYRQLANESLSSATTAYTVLDQEILDPNVTLKILKNDTSFVGSEHSERKCCWVDTGRQVFFSIKELNGWIYNLSSVEGNSSEKTELFDFDHIHPDSNAGSPVTFFYGALGTNCFQEFHAILEEASRKGKVTYVYRPVLLSDCEDVHDCGSIGTQGTMNLGGYGVELALKNMEYKAMDDTSIKKGMILEDPHTEDLTQEVRGFIFSRILERMPDSTHEIMAFRDYLLSATISDTLDVWELKDLGHQTAQRIVQASDCIQSMQEINQNFPSVVSSLSRMKLNDSIKDEIMENQRMIPPGKSLMALNGALINIEQIDIYTLVDMVNQEISMGDQFSKLKIPQNYVRRMLSTLAPAVSEMSRVDFRSNHVYYLNNLEEDAKYMGWRSNLNEILMPAFPGQPRYIRKNIFNAVFIFDPASSCGLDSVDMIISLYESNVPIRFGVELYSANLVNKVKVNDGRLPLLQIENDGSVEDDISSLIIQLFIFINENHGALTSFQFLSNVNRLKSESGMSADEDLDLSHVEGAFIETMLPKVKSPPQDTLLRLEKEQIFRRKSDESSMIAFNLGVANLHCPLLMNGLIFEANEDALLNAMNEELPRIQELVYYGHITSHTDVLGKLLSQTGIPRYNPQILSGGKVKQKYVSLAASFFENDSIFTHLNYLHSVGTADDLKPVTHLLVIDVTSRKGIKFLRSGIHYLMRGSKLGRLAVLFSARPNDDDSLSSLFIKTFEITVSSYSYKKTVLEFLDRLCLFYEHDVLSIVGSENSQNFHEKIFQLADEHNISPEKLKSVLSEFSSEKLSSHLRKVKQFLSRHLGYHLDNNAIITNGRVTHPIDEDTFLSLDLDLLESVEYRQNVKHIVEMIEEVKWQDADPDSLTSKFISDVIMYVTSAMSRRDRSSESARFEVLKADYSAVVIPNENSTIHIDAVLDPLSPLGQKLSSFLHVLGKYVQPSMRIVLNPMGSLVDLPLKNYYRFALPSLDEFSSNDGSINGPKAFFSNMPLSKTLTMNLDVPEPWLVEPVVTVHDLDNILLENIGDSKTLSAVFELEALLLTGHCSEKGQDHPRGLQLILGTRNIPHLVDTLVMANLGYWQLKVSPGIWYLNLAPGRSSDLYSMGDNNEDSGIKTPSERIIIDDFRGKLVRFEVAKRRGKEHEKLLIPTNDGQKKSNYQTHQHAWNSNLFKWASGIIGRTEETKTNQKTLQRRDKVWRYGETINIFSVASGHLYERFLKIMILSVLKNTHRPVKFWFIKNYLSPPFKDVIPQMAKEYDFGYELITYKWPSWLHKQKEKQRIIWAYKILFLDVIFPLSLQKVIFVDADQVVRADMGDLYDMDIDGNPLAYTPFCDNNRDMDGYRFWRQGFWREHLQGKPYHISALYVVDLVKFRETAAGDNLRVFYETLSKDPNSLSNLDQDLPNYAQHTVPIFSLPQEWLWCESWCGNSTKSGAKTIDLCNNPMTKEPKLQGAKRIVSEWVGLDAEARRFTAKVMGEEFEEAVVAVAVADEKDDTDSTDSESVAEL